MTKQIVLLALFTLAAGTAAAADPGDYTAAGACKYQKTFLGSQVMPRSTGCKGTQCILKLAVTLPSSSNQTQACAAGPYPVVFFFNGFQSLAAYYKDYANRLASYGYAVVQYDTAPLAIIPDNVELLYMQRVLDNLKQAAAEPTHVLYGRINFEQLAVAGHSRGGKLAALHLAQNSAVKAAYLVDPVDNTLFSPESPLYPSAVKALKAAQPTRIAGITGGGITSLCNPEGSNYPGFYDALGKGSWLQVLPQATHLAFAKTPVGAFPICGKGATPDKVAVPIAAASCTAWIDSAMKSKPIPAEFKEWVKKGIDAGVMTFTVKK